MIDSHKDFPSSAFTLSFLKQQRIFYNELKDQIWPDTITLFTRMKIKEHLIQFLTVVPPVASS